MENNQPLKIDTITTHQQTASLITYLERSKKYHLLFGDSLAAFAKYDLQTFEDSISSLYPLNYGEIQAVKKDNIQPAHDRKNGWVWPVIILAVLALSYLSFRLVADMNKAHK